MRMCSRGRRRQAELAFSLKQRCSASDNQRQSHLDSRLINRRVYGGNGQIGLIRSDVFLNKVVYDYTMQPSNGSDDDPIAGEPSEHD